VKAGLVKIGLVKIGLVKIELVKIESSSRPEACEAGRRAGTAQEKPLVCGGPG